jgi:hypothetical protein
MILKIKLIYVHQTDILKVVIGTASGRRRFVMYAADGHTGATMGAGGAGFGSIGEALRVGAAFADYLNSSVAAEFDGPACGEVLIAPGEIQGKLAASHAALLRRFDAADAHKGRRVRLSLGLAGREGPDDREGG